MKVIDKEFYKKSIRPDWQRSYKIVAKIFWQFFQPESVVDYGCGTGWQLYFLKHYGALNLLGFEVNDDAWKLSPEGIEIAKRSLETPINLKRNIDLGICIEVAEHISEKFADMIIENICRHAKIVAFSAATPGQGGHGHINEQPWEYWEKKFNKTGFEIYSGPNEKIRAHVKKRKAKFWYVNNLRILKRAK